LGYRDRVIMLEWLKDTVYFIKEDSKAFGMWVNDLLSSSVHQEPRSIATSDEQRRYLSMPSRHKCFMRVDPSNERAQYGYLCFKCDCGRWTYYWPSAFWGN